MKKQYIGLITSERRAFIRVYHLWELRWCLASLAGFTVILLHGSLRGFSRLHGHGRTRTYLPIYLPICGTDLPTYPP